MDIALLMAGVLVLAALLNGILRWTYLVVFFLGEKPIIWGLLVTGAGGLFWFVCARLGWSVSVPFWSSLIAVSANTIPFTSRKQAREEYAEMGLKYRGVLHSLGLAGFVIASLAGWSAFYGERIVPH